MIFWFYENPTVFSWKWKCVQHLTNKTRTQKPIICKTKQTSIDTVQWYINNVFKYFCDVNPLYVIQRWFLSEVLFTWYCIVCSVHRIGGARQSYFQCASHWLTLPASHSLAHLAHGPEGKWVPIFGQIQVLIFIIPHDPGII